MTTTTPTERSTPAGSLGWRCALLVFATVAVVHTLSPSIQVADSRLSVPVATQVLRHGTLDLSRDPQVTTLTNQSDVQRVDGRLLPFFPWPAMLFAMPGALVADALGRDPAALRPSNPNQTWQIEVPVASTLVALTAVVLAVVTLDVLPGGLRTRRRLAVCIALVFAFATGAWSTGSRALWQHTPSMLFLALALLAALRFDRHRLWSVAFGMALAGAFVVRPSNGVAVAFFLVWLAVTHRRSLARVAVGVATGMAVITVPFVAVNVASYHSWLPAYYAAQRLGTKPTVGFFESMAMLLVSPSRGLVIYDPIIIAAVVGVWLKWRRHSITALDLTVCAAVVAQLILVARSGSTGGSSYGPRLMTDVLPYVVYLSIPSFVALFEGGVRASIAGGRRVLVFGMAVIVGWGVLVSASGALLRSSYCWSANPVLVDEKPSRIWDWTDPQFFRPVKDAFDGASIHDVVLESCSAA